MGNRLYSNVLSCIKNAISDAEINLNESLQNTYLKELVRQVHDNIADDKMGWSPMTNASEKASNYIKRIISHYGIKMDQVDDSVNMEFEAGDKDGIKIARQIIRENGKKHGLILVLSNDDEIIAVINNTNVYDPRQIGNCSDCENKKQYEIIDMLERSNFVILDFTDLEHVGGLRNERWHRKDGSYFGKNGSEARSNDMKNSNHIKYLNALQQRKAAARAKQENPINQVFDKMEEFQNLIQTIYENPGKYAKIKYPVRYALDMMAGCFRAYIELIDDHLDDATSSSGYMSDWVVADHEKTRKKFSDAVENMNIRLANLREQIEKTDSES